MTAVNFQTESCSFYFTVNDVKERLDHYKSEHNVDKAIYLSNFLKSSSDEPIKIPEEDKYFGYIALDLISSGKGLIICRNCNGSYQPNAPSPNWD